MLAEDLQMLYTVQDVADLVELEGIGYSIQEYLGSESIEDPYLSDLWAQAKNLLDEIEGMLRAELSWGR